MIHTLLLWIGLSIGILPSAFTQTLDPHYTLHVNVLDREYSTTVYDAYVNLYKGELLVETTKTDLLGRAQFDTVEKGMYTLSIDKEGYHLYEKEVDLSGAKFEKTVEIVLSKKKIEKIYETESKGIFSLADRAASPPTRTAHTSTAGYMAETSLPSSGQVTAAEWNDLHNWVDWLALLDKEEYTEMTQYWGIYPTSRYSVLVLDEAHNPIPLAEVSLLDENGQQIWQSITDHSGKAELWHEAFQVDNSIPRKIKVVKGNQTAYADDIKDIAQGSNTIIIDQPCQETRAVDIVFTVDATSSMSDEIDYLKSELVDVMARVKNEANEIDLRMGSLFYRDTNDDYLTRVSPLDRDIDQAITFIKEQHAHGGGDFPEAVEVAMKEAHDLKWRAEALKLHIVLLDAPPHHDAETLAVVRQEIRRAAQKGIRLIPITASGIHRETEFLMKFMAILTNGTYAFITDDSGIGHSHLTPVVDDYEVEKLNDLMVRVISEMITSKPCKEEALRMNAPEIKIFPNPATHYVTVMTDDIPEKITLTSSSGMIIHAIKPSTKETKIDLEQLVSGVYTVTIHGGSSIVTSKKVIVVR